MKIKLLILFLIALLHLNANAQSGVIKVRKKVNSSLCLNGYTDGAVQPHLLCGGKGLYVTNSTRYKVTSFVVLLESVKQVEHLVNGNMLSGDICDDINKLKTGDFIYINKIKALDNTTGKEVSMPPLRFQVRGMDKSDKKTCYQQLNEDNY